MFKITGFQKINGEIHLIIVTDDSTCALFLRLFKHAHEFAELYEYKVSKEINADLRQKERPEKMALVGVARGEQLKTYCQLSGSRYERVRILDQVGQLAENGHAPGAMSKSLGIARSTVSEYIKLFQKGAAREEAVDGPSNLVPLGSRKRRTP